MKKPFLYILITSLAFLNSCYSVKTLSTSGQIDEFSKRGDVRILTAVTREGETYYFNREAPAWIIDGTVTGPPEITINYTNVSSLVRNNEGLPEYVEYNGQRYKIISLKKSDYICHSTDSISIPIDDLSYVRVLKQNDLAFGVVFIIVLGSIGFLAGISLLFIL